ncbi:MAG: hypothetical protein JW809_11130 [Pirellulales bacterium]|nr:hypothetical protein [Pirellulales bacterium]
MMGTRRRWFLCAALAAAAWVCGGTVQAVVTSLPLDGAGSGDLNGISVDISGNTVIVGGTGGGNGNTKGWAQVFVHDVTGWRWQATLTVNDAALADGDQFGWSVAIDGNSAVVGAHKSGATNKGKAYVFNRYGDVWQPSDAPDWLEATGSNGFGYDVDISGDRVLVGSPWANKAYVFSRSSGVWDAGVALPSPGTVFFGQSVALSGDLAVVGNATVNAAYFFRLDGGNWVSDGTVLQGAGTDEFGFRVDIDGQRAIVGAKGMDVGGVVDAGSATIYARQAGSSTWTVEALLTAPDGAAQEEFGSAVAICGDYAVVGACYASPSGEETGAAYIFHYEESVWTFVKKVVVDESRDGDQFGQAVAAGTEVGVIGAWKFDGSDGTTPNVGAAYVTDYLPLESLPGDANRDGFVDGADAAILAAHWLSGGGMTWDDGDFNGDETVDDLDLAILAANWRPAPPAAAVPEPGALGLAILLFAAAVVWRRRGADAAR